MVDVDVPFNNCITGISAFTHKAGIHAKAILSAPETYEALDPHDFGLTRYISIAHRLTGWSAVRARADQLGLSLSDAHVKALTHHIKVLADERARRSTTWTICCGTGERARRDDGARRRRATAMGETRSHRRRSRAQPGWTT